MRERLLDLCMPEPNSGCWLWLGSTNANPAINANARPIVYDDDGRQVQAHRESYREFVGPLADDESALHRCDTPLCINPEHLFKGDQMLNISDMNLKGRNGHSLKTHCPYGHAYDELNTYLLSGSRHCKTCMRRRVDEYAMRKKQ